MVAAALAHQRHQRRGAGGGVIIALGENSASRLIIGGGARHQSIAPSWRRRRRRQRVARISGSIIGGCGWRARRRVNVRKSSRCISIGGIGRQSGIGASCKSGSGGIGGIAAAHQRRIIKRSGASAPRGIWRQRIGARRHRRWHRMRRGGAYRGKQLAAWRRRIIANSKAALRHNIAHRRRNRRIGGVMASAAALIGGIGGAHRRSGSAA